MTYRYRFVGDAPEHFPEPPIARMLEPGEEFESETPLTHARLLLLMEPAAETGEPDQTQIAKSDTAPVAPDVVSTPQAEPITVEDSGEAPASA
jgi:hypothetical protein